MIFYKVKPVVRARAKLCVIRRLKDVRVQCRRIPSVLTGRTAFVLTRARRRILHGEPLETTKRPPDGEERRQEHSGYGINDGAVRPPPLFRQFGTSPETHVARGQTLYLSHLSPREFFIPLPLFFCPMPLVAGETRARVRRRPAFPGQTHTQVIVAGRFFLKKIKKLYL